MFWLPAIALGVRFDSAVGLVLLLVGLAVPGVSDIAFINFVYDEHGTGRRLDSCRAASPHRDDPGRLASPVVPDTWELTGWDAVLAVPPVVVDLSVIATWLYNAAGGRVLIPVVFHTVSSRLQSGWSVTKSSRRLACWSSSG